MEKEYKYLPAIIALSATLVISIVMLVNKISTLKSLILVFSFLLGFYIVGSIFRWILVKFKSKEEPAEPSSSDSELDKDLEDVKLETDK